MWGVSLPSDDDDEEEEEEEVLAEARGKEAHSADPEEGPGGSEGPPGSPPSPSSPRRPATSAMDWFLPLESEAVGDSEPLVGTFAESLAEPTANRRAGGDDDGGGDDVSEPPAASPDASAAARPATAFEDGAIGPGGVLERALRRDPAARGARRGCLAAVSEALATGRAAGPAAGVGDETDASTGGSCVHLT